MSDSLFRDRPMSEEDAELKVLRRLFKKLPKCSDCKEPATRIGSFLDDDGVRSDHGDTTVIIYQCDKHTDACNVSDATWLPYAGALRAYNRIKERL